MAVENMRAPEIGGFKKECWYMYFTYFNFVSDQPYPPPAKTRGGVELVRDRE